MARELDEFGWTMFAVEVLSHRYFCAGIKEWEITTVITVKTLAFYAGILKVGIIMINDYFLSILFDVTENKRLETTATE